MQAIRAFNLLADGAGGIDWAGLPVVVAHLGVVDVDGLIHRLGVIKLHRPPEDGARQGRQATHGNTLIE